MRIQFNERRIGDVLVLNVSGICKYEYGATVLEGRILSSLDASNKVLLNLKDVTSFDQRAEGIVLSCFRTSQRKGKVLKLLNVQQNHRIGLVSLTRFCLHLDVFDDEVTAIRSFC